MWSHAACEFHTGAGRGTARRKSPAWYSSEVLSVQRGKPKDPANTAVSRIHCKFYHYPTESLAWHIGDIDASNRVPRRGEDNGEAYEQKKAPQRTKEHPFLTASMATAPQALDFGLYPTLSCTTSRVSYSAWSPLPVSSIRECRLAEPSGHQFTHTYSRETFAQHNDEKFVYYKS